MPYPKNDPRTEVCIVVSRDGVTIYGNAAAFRSLAKWMSWIAESDESEHYECHVRWHLLRHHAKQPNVTVVFDDPPERRVVKRKAGRARVPFEVTFMAVTRRDLTKLKKSRLRPAAPRTDA